MNGWMKLGERVMHPSNNTTFESFMHLGHHGLKSWKEKYPLEEEFEGDVGKLVGRCKPSGSRPHLW